jgi:hypothetical protein
MNSTQLTALIRREGSRATSCLDSLPPSGWACPLATRKVRPGPRVLQSEGAAWCSMVWHMEQPYAQTCSNNKRAFFAIPMNKSSLLGRYTLACPDEHMQCLRYIWTASLLDRQSLGRRIPGCSLPSCRVSSAQVAVWSETHLTSRHFPEEPRSLKVLPLKVLLKRNA